MRKNSKEYYRSINWNQFLQECYPINNSIENIQKLIDSNLYNVTVLTHVLSKHEREEKERYLQDKIPNLNFIAVEKPNPKWESANCKNAILVDDYSENLKEWHEHGGIPIKFSLKEKEYEYQTIKSLDKLIEMYPIFLKKSNKKVLKNKR